MFNDVSCFWRKTTIPQVCNQWLGGDMFILGEADSEGVGWL
jgi:hypothetical protein